MSAAGPCYNALVLKRFARKAARKIYRRLKHRPEHDALAALSPEEHARRCDEDLESLRLWIGGLERIPSDAGPLDSHENRAALRRRWAAFLDYLVALDSIKNFHGGFARFEMDSRQNARSFVLAYASFLAQYAAGYRWIRRFDRHKLAATLLDEPAPELGL
ncbi:MAG: hypothetical protein HYY16_09960, partial [Planctomycetes bacterium]|nr:hypothetical protein [Planctomycetota bacterium]